MGDMENKLFIDYLNERDCKDKSIRKDIKMLAVSRWLLIIMFMAYFVINYLQMERFSTVTKTQTDLMTGKILLVLEDNHKILLQNMQIQNKILRLLEAK